LPAKDARLLLERVALVDELPVVQGDSLEQLFGWCCLVGAERVPGKPSEVDVLRIEGERPITTRELSDSSNGSEGPFEAVRTSRSSVRPRAILRSTR